jgi:hypothetical protein
VIFIGAAVSCVIAAMFVIRVTVALFRDERIIFAR